MKNNIYYQIIIILLVFTNSYAGHSVTAVLCDTPPKIDGKTEDPIWQKGAVVTEFVQREPNTGDPVSEKTVVFICYDTDNIYFGFRCYDDPSKITAKEMERDVVLRNEDKVVIILDTFLDRRNGYYFEVNPRGAYGDALLSLNGASMNKEWDGIWEGRSSIHDKGWDVEVVIPFKTLNFNPSQDTWNIKFMRDIQYKKELAYWPVANINAYKYQVSDGGILAGLEGISHGIGLDVSPYALAGINQKRDHDLKSVSDIGFDVFYQLTHGLKSVLTVNTDFAQTEVDDRQINLTRFKLYFPEKRDFFLDGANYFQFAVEGDRTNPKSRQIIPFFSRRIGLSETGNPIPIVGGVKVTGQTGPWNWGFLDVVDERETGKENFAVMRVSRNYGSQSAIGLVGTLGNAVSSESNTVLGADIKLATSTFKGDKNVAFLLYGLKSNTNGFSGKDYAFGSELNYPNDFFSFRLGYMEIADNFLAGVGFLPRKNIRNSYGQVGLGPRPNKWGILQVQIESNFDYITDLTNRLLTREIGFTPLGIRFLSGDEAAFKISQLYESINEYFHIFGEYVIPPGTYEFWRYEVALSSAERRNFWGQMDYHWGKFWNGNRDQIELKMGYKVCVPLALELEYEHNDVSLPDGDFTTDVYRFSFDILFSTRMVLKSFIQYDNESQKIGWQSRFRWIINPGNEIIFVWNSIWQDPLDRTTPYLKDFALTESTSRLKINYNYRF